MFTVNKSMLHTDKLQLTQQLCEVHSVVILPMFTTCTTTKQIDGIQLTRAYVV